MNGLRQSQLQRRDLCAGRLDVAACLLDVELRRETGLIAEARQLVGFVLRLRVRLRNSQPVLQRAHVDVVRRNLGRERDQGVLEVCFARLDRRPGRVNLAAYSAEHVQFPTGIEAQPDTSAARRWPRCPCH